MKFYDMGNKPLKYSIRENGKIVIPAGTKGVKIAFKQSYLFRQDDSGNFIPLNVYEYNGKLIHA